MEVQMFNIAHNVFKPLF